MTRLSWQGFFVSAAVLVGATVLGGGCTTHGEGGRCDRSDIVNNQFADCDNGLTCKSRTELSLPDGGGNPQTDICCPADPSQATTDICRGSPPSPGSDAGIPDGSLESSTIDAPNDVTSDVETDAPSEASTDAGSDASDAAGD